MNWEPGIIGPSRHLSELAARASSNLKGPGEMKEGDGPVTESPGRTGKTLQEPTKQTRGYKKAEGDRGWFETTESSNVL